MPRIVDKQSELTTRELQIQERLARGSGYAEVAGDLGISPHTVSSYARKISIKGKARNQTSGFRDRAGVQRQSQLDKVTLDQDAPPVEGVPDQDGFSVRAKMLGRYVRHEPTYSTEVLR